MGITAVHFQSLMIACVSLAVGRARVATFSKRDGATWYHIERVPSSTADTQTPLADSPLTCAEAGRYPGLQPPPLELCPWTTSPEWCCLGSQTAERCFFGALSQKQEAFLNPLARRVQALLSWGPLC